MHNTNLGSFCSLLLIELSIKGILRNANHPPLRMVNVILAELLHYFLANGGLKKFLNQYII